MISVNTFQHIDTHTNFITFIIGSAYLRHLHCITLRAIMLKSNVVRAATENPGAATRTGISSRERDSVPLLKMTSMGNCFCYRRATFSGLDGSLETTAFKRPQIASYR